VAQAARGGQVKVFGAVLFVALAVLAVVNASLHQWVLFGCSVLGMISLLLAMLSVVQRRGGGGWD
jgi:bacteriorhodopsin